MARGMDSFLRIKADLELNTKPARQSLKEFNESTDKNISVLNRANAVMKEFNTTASKLDSGEKIQGMSKAFYTTQRAAADLAKQITELYDKINSSSEMAEAKKNEKLVQFDIYDADSIKAETERIEKEISDSENAVNSLRREFIDLSSGLDSRTNNITKEISTTLAEMSKLGKYKKTLTPDSEEFATADARMSLFRTHLAELRKEYANIGNSADAMRLGELGSQIDEASGKIKELRNSVWYLHGLESADFATGVSSDIQKFEKLSEEFTELYRNMSMYQSTSNKTVGSNNRMGSSMRTLFPHLHKLRFAFYDLRFAVNMFSKAFKVLTAPVRGVIKLFGKLVSKIHEVRKSHGSGFKDMLKQVMKYGLGVRSLYFLIRRLRTQFKESLEAMAQKVPLVNDQISSIVSNVNQMKASLATMAQPLLVWVVPAFQKLTEYAVQAMEAVAKLFALMTGQNFIIKATGAWTDYAASVKSAKDNLLGIDELNVLNDSGKSGLADTTSYGYEMIDAESGLLQKIKDSWANADFTELGGIVGNKFKEMLNKLSARLPGVTEFGNKVAKSIGTGINGAIETQGLANTLGSTIAQTLNSAFDILGTFVNTVHWQSIGEFIKTGIQTFLDTANVKTWTFNVTNLIRGLLESLYTLVSDPNTWTLFGEKLSEAISGVLSSMGEKRKVQSGTKVVQHVNFAPEVIPVFEEMTGWEILGKGVSDLVKGLIESFTKALNDNKDDFVDAVVQFIESIDWTGIIFDLTNLAKSLVTSLLRALAKIDLIQFADASVGGFFTQGMKQGEMSEQLDKLIAGEITEEEFKESKSAIESQYQTAFGKAIQSFIASTIENNEISSQINESTDSLGQMIIKGLKAPFLSDTFISDWKLIFGRIFGKTENDYGVAGEVAEVHSPSKKFMRLGNLIITGFMKPFDSLAEKFKAPWEALVDIVKSPINAMIGIINHFLSAVQSMQNSIADAFNSISFDLPDIIGGGHVGFNITRWTAPQIPALAKGAVIPANKPFMAMLGDQTNGTNIEAPLSTIEDAVANVFAPYLSDILDVLEYIKDKEPVRITDRMIARSAENGRKQLGVSIIN